MFIVFHSLLIMATGEQITNKHLTNEGNITYIYLFEIHIYVVINEQVLGCLLITSAFVKFMCYLSCYYSHVIIYYQVSGIKGLDIPQ